MGNERILVIKLGALGDFIYALGAMRAIREHHKAAHITLLTQKPYVSLAEKSGLFDYIILDSRPKYNPLDWLQFRRILNKPNFTRVYDLQNNDRTENYFRLFSPRPEWIGIAKGASHRNADPDRRKFHAFIGLKNNLKLAGINNINLDALDWMTSDISRFNLPQPYALLVTGSAPSRPNKRWPASHFRDLIGRLNSIGIHPILLGTKSESLVNGKIAKGLNVTDLSGQTTLDDIPELARHAALAVGNDTGPMHIISMTGCPSLFFYRSDESTIEKHGPQAVNAYALEAATLDDIKADEVFDRVKSIRR